MAIACLLGALVACSEDDSKAPSNTVKQSTTTLVSHATSTSESHQTTSTTRAAEDSPPGESIGVTDKVTIVITDPESDG